MAREEDQIIRGKALHDKTPEGFTYFLAELDERLETAKDRALHFDDATASEFRHRYQALSELRGWLEDEIERGAELLAKKQITDLRQSHADPQEAQ